MNTQVANQKWTVKEVFLVSLAMIVLARDWWKDFEISHPAVATTFVSGIVGIAGFIVMHSWVPMLLFGFSALCTMIVMSIVEG